MEHTAWSIPHGAYLHTRQSKKPEARKATGFCLACDCMSQRPPRPLFADELGGPQREADAGWFQAVHLGRGRRLQPIQVRQSLHPLTLHPLTLHPLTLPDPTPPPYAAPGTRWKVVCLFTAKQRSSATAASRTTSSTRSATSARCSAGQQGTCAWQTTVGSTTTTICWWVVHGLR